MHKKMGSFLAVLMVSLMVGCTSNTLNEAGQSISEEEKIKLANEKKSPSNVEILEQISRGECPNIEYINCQPALDSAGAELCNAKNIEWLKENCQIGIVY